MSRRARDYFLYPAAGGYVGYVIRISSSITQPLTGPAGCHLNTSAATLRTGGGRRVRSGLHHAPSEETMATRGAAGRLDLSHAGAGRLSVFLYGAPESRWLVNGNTLRAVYRLSHITGVSLGNFSNTKLCQGQKSFDRTKRRQESIKVSADSRCQKLPPPLC